MNMFRLSTVTALPLGYLYLNRTRADAKSNKQNTLISAYCNIPHHEKAYRGGEDAWICTDSLIAVADGVGGWNRKGVDPGIFARELCSHVLSRFNSLINARKHRYEVDMWELLVQSVKQTQATGTSTFVMALLDEEDPHLRTLNLGDSGVLILRKNQANQLESVFRSQEKQYRFNAPYQCGTGKKLPYHSDVFLHQVQHGDFIVMGSDGLFDNVFDPEIIKCLPTSEVEPQEAATCLANKALLLSQDTKYDSPFAQGARKAGKRHPGGKEDDITVVVSKVNLNIQ